ncbi:GTPase HflX [Hyphococcus sp.]|uniref:GTPase HflX n=1 Tax=Hyphococcus sp. TaxID=2038636 RepID=UPI003D14F603
MSEPKTSENLFAIVVHPAFRGDENLRAPEARLEEATGLAAAIELQIVDALIAPIQKPRPATLLGQGKVEEIKARLDAHDPRPALVIVDGALSPVQHRNLEKEWDAKVLDRTALILEIFGARAQTAEGRLQVELAHLDYQRSRLVRSWTHLERQRGGAGFLGGPGERQIESDRRALDDKIIRLKKKLEEVRRTRTLQRAKRKRAPHPIVALVGYTNAGKSTLFNRLTRASVMAEDLLFATLDPTMRAIDLPSGVRLILSDTVGFISDLPTQLVAAFRATLEEVLEADVVIHVRDIAHEDTDAQRADVIKVLAELGLKGDDARPVIEALNKIDLLDADDRLDAEAIARLSQTGRIGTLAEPVRAAISAETGEGVGRLLELVEEALTVDHERLVLRLPSPFGAARAWLHGRAEILEEDQSGDDLIVTVRLSKKTEGQFFKQFPAASAAFAQDLTEQRA